MVIFLDLHCLQKLKKSKSVTDPSSRNKFKNAIARSKVLLRKLKEETGSPGLVCAVSIDGTLVWSTALGYSDVENGVKCNVNTLMRIASISKSLTAIGVGTFWNMYLGMILLCLLGLWSSSTMCQFFTMTRQFGLSTFLLDSFEK